MSWNWRVGFFRKIDNDFNPDLILSDALLVPQFFQALNEQSPKVVKYTASHLKEIIDIAIGRTPPSNDDEQKQCINILTKAPVIKEKFLKSSDLFNYLAESFSNKNLNYLPAVQLIQSLFEMTSGEALALLSDSSSFYSNLLNLLPSSSIHAFILDIFSKRVKFVINWAVQIEADKPLISFLVDEEPKVRCSLSILSTLVSILPSKSASMLRLASLDIISCIFTTGIEAPTNEVAYGAFHLLVIVYNNCDEDELFKISDFLQSKYHSMCQYIIRDKSFTKDKCALCELLNLVISASQTLSPEILDTISFLFDLFLENPTISFLHLVFYSIIQSLSNFDPEFTDFLTKHDVANKLLDVEQKRDQIKASFWGQCTQIEIIIKDKIQGDEKWNDYVQNTLDSRQKIMETEYGGEVPKIKTISSDSDLELQNYSIIKLGSELSKTSEKSSSSSDDNSDNSDEFVSYSEGEEDTASKEDTQNVEQKTDVEEKK